MVNGLLWESEMLGSFITKMCECKGDLEIEISDSHLVWNFDDVARKCISEENCPNTADCLFIINDAVIFLEFKRWRCSAEEKEKEMERKLRDKVTDSALLYWRCLSGCKEFFGKNVEFWIVTDQPSKEIRNTQNRHANITASPIPDFLKRFRVMINGEPLYFNKICYFTCSDFKAHMNKLRISCPCN